MRRHWMKAVAVAAILTGASNAGATVIDFTGGTVHLNDGTTQSTNNSVNWQNVDYYEEGGFRLDFSFSTATPEAFASNVGDYYSAGNDVIHAHWETGNFGEVTAVTVSRIDGQVFDLNYFVLTSNTDTGGSAASGNELARVTASNGSFLSLPPEDWGFPAVQIFLPASFDAITSFTFTVDNAVDCFGMDNFFIDEDAPPPVPEPATLALFGSGIVSAVLLRRRRR